MQNSAVGPKLGQSHIVREKHAPMSNEDMFTELWDAFTFIDMHTANGGKHSIFVGVELVLRL